MNECCLFNLHNATVNVWVDHGSVGGYEHLARRISEKTEGFSVGALKGVTSVKIMKCLCFIVKMISGWVC